MNQNMIETALGIWRLLKERGKYKKHKHKFPTITITFSEGEWNLIDAVLSELGEEITDES